MLSCSPSSTSCKRYPLPLPLVAISNDLVDDGGAGKGRSTVVSTPKSGAASFRRGRRGEEEDDDDDVSRCVRKLRGTGAPRWYVVVVLRAKDTGKREEESARKRRRKEDVVVIMEWGARGGGRGKVGLYTVSVIIFRFIRAATQRVGQYNEIDGYLMICVLFVAFLMGCTAHQKEKGGGGRGPVGRGWVQGGGRGKIYFKCWFR